MEVWMVKQPEAVSFSLEGRTALVTGSGKNIGKKIAVELARYGANVVVNGLRDEAAVSATVREIESLGAKASPFLADISDPAQAQAMVDHARAKFGALDIIVNNAAVRPFQPFLSISLEDWDHILRTNLSSAFYLARLAIPAMVERRWGRIIQISGMDGFTGESNRVHNVVCKAGVHAMAKCIGQEFGAAGITANTVAPGWVDTERDWAKYPHVNMEKEKEKIPARRIGTVGDIAGACVYLASDAASYMNGQVLHVNGGWHMY
jgi:NAD(P)-dependent dehydrogenase (short-subunit alcohol dehydrogenase family)